ncbi:MAG: endonuclease/exonuclease/phosphatase family protein [Brumimicrobium sp.]|nr:endonuclease/exonuclease/phosphatase family protein [Brumimicrobium sp.]
MTKFKSLVFKLLKSVLTFLAVLLALCLGISYLSPVISPEHFWWIQIFGLAYPVLFFLSLIILLIFIYINRRVSYLLGIILIIGIPIHLRFFGISFSGNTEIQGTEKIRIMSYNVRLFDIYKWINPDKSDSKQKFLKVFEKNDPDILCLQEYMEDNRTVAHIKDKDIMEAGGFTNVAKQTTVQTVGVNFGLAIFSRFPIIKKGTVESTKTEMFCQFADIALYDDTMRVYNLHLQSIRFQQDEYSLFDQNAPTAKTKLEKIMGLFEKLKYAYGPRVDEVKAILEHARSCPHPVVICGDFNDPPVSYIYDKFNDEFFDAFRETSYGIGKTYAGKIPAGRIDYIFFDENFEALSFNRQQEVLSDHYAITADLLRVPKDTLKKGK